MKPFLRILFVLLLVSVMTDYAQPAFAARLASVSGEAGATPVEKSADFKLSDQDAVRVNYNVQKTGDKCSVQIKVYREQNGRWLVVSTVLRTTGSATDSRPLTLPAGSYRIKVIAKNAKFDISVDN